MSPEVRRLPLLPAGARRMVQVVLDNQVLSCSAVVHSNNADNQLHTDPSSGDLYINISSTDFDRLRRCCVLSNSACFLSNDVPVFERKITGSASAFDQPLLRWCEDLEHVRSGGEAYADTVEAYEKAGQEVGEYRDLLAAFPNADAVAEYQKADKKVGSWQELVVAQQWPLTSRCAEQQQQAPLVTARWEHKGVFLSAHNVDGRALLLAYGNPKPIIDASCRTFSSRNDRNVGSHVQRRIEASPSGARARSPAQPTATTTGGSPCVEFSAEMKNFAALSAEAVMEAGGEGAEERSVRSYAMHWLTPELPGNFKNSQTGTICLMDNEDAALSCSMLLEYARDYGRMVGKEVISVVTKAGDTEMHSLESLLPTSNVSSPAECDGDGGDGGGGGGRAPDKTTTHPPRSRSNSNASSTDLFGEELVDSSKGSLVRLSVDSASSWLSNRSSIESIDEIEGHQASVTSRARSTSPCSPRAKPRAGRLRRLSVTLNLGGRGSGDGSGDGSDGSDECSAQDKEDMPPRQMTAISPADLETMTPRAIRMLTASDEEKRAALALTVRTCLLDEGVLLGEEAVDLCCQRVLANLTVTPAMNLVIESGCAPAVYQPRFVVLCGSGQLRVLTVAFIGEPARGDRPDTKCTPFMLRMLSPNLIPTDDEHADDDGDDGDDSGAGGSGAAADCRGPPEGVPPPFAMRPEPQELAQLMTQTSNRAPSPFVTPSPNLKPKALSLGSSTCPCGAGRRRTEYWVGFTQCESTQECVEQGLRWMQEAVASGNYNFDLDIAPTSRYYKVNAMREWLGNSIADVVAAQKLKPNFCGQLSFVGHVVVGMTRPAKAGQLLAARLREHLQQLDPATPMNMKKKLDAEVLPEVSKVIQKVNTDEELKEATSGFARTAKSLVIGTEGFTQVTSLLASPASNTAGLPYKVLRRSMVQAGAQLDSSKLGYLEANHIVFVLEKKTLRGGQVRMRFAGNARSASEVRWVSEKTAEGDVILLRLEEDTASVDASELLRGSSALFKGLLIKSTNLQGEERAELKLHGGKLLQGAKEASSPTSRALTEGEKLLSAAAAAAAAASSSSTSSSSSSSLPSPLSSIVAN